MTQAAASKERTAPGKSPVVDSTKLKRTNVWRGTD
jgi:hypothetical protein